MGLLPRKNKSQVPVRRRSQPDSSTENSVNGTSRYAFKRSQTLTGSSSLYVDKVTSKDAHIKSPRERAHELAQHRRRLTRTLGFIMLGAGLLLVFMWQFIADVHVSASGSLVIQDKNRYESVIEKYLAERPAERFRLSLAGDSLSKYVSTQLPEVESVKLGGYRGLSMGHFEITMRRPVAGWNIGSSQHFVDTNGVAFERNYYDAPGIQIVDESGIPAASGAAVASTRFLGFVGRVVAAANDYDLSVKSITIPVGTTRQVEARLDGVDYPVRLSIDRPVGEQVEDMNRTIGHMKSRSINPEYIDVRVSRRVYYR